MVVILDAVIHELNEYYSSTVADAVSRVHQRGEFLSWEFTPYDLPRYDRFSKSGGRLWRCGERCAKYRRAKRVFRFSACVSEMIDVTID